jgi:hypothetical protein
MVVVVVVVVVVITTIRSVDLELRFQPESRNFFSLVRSDRKREKLIDSADICG